MNISNMYIGAPAQNPTGWQLLAQVTLSANAATMTTPTIPQRRFLKAHIWIEGFAVADYHCLQLNGDVAANYDTRLQNNGAADALTNNAVRIVLANGAGTWPRYTIFDTINDASKFKRGIISTADGGFADNAPGATTGVSLWENAADLISTITVRGVGGQNLLADSSISVFGSD